jgi:hypothetical protein
VIARLASAIGVLLFAALTSGVSLAASDVELFGRVLAVEGQSMALGVDGARLVLDVAEIDPRFVETLRPGDDVRVAAFRLADGSLLVYSVFLQARDAPAQRPKPAADSDPE